MNKGMSHTLNAEHKEIYLLSIQRHVNETLGKHQIQSDIGPIRFYVHVRLFFFLRHGRHGSNAFLVDFFSILYCLTELRMGSRERQAVQRMV